MGLESILKFFQPKDRVFHSLFEKITTNLVEMSQAFHEGLKDFDLNDDSILRKMSDYEHKNDEFTHEIFVELGKNFITPFDREDIHHLATALDDIADYIYATTKYIYLYKSPQMKAYAEFALLIQKACVQIQIAVANLKDIKNTAKIKEACIKINSIENIADDLLSDSLIKLFETNDPIFIIKGKSVLNYLETVTDKAEDVANTIDNIIVKYA
jgi:uncharacterized protein